MAGSSNIKHVRYRFKQGDVSTGNVDYSTCYFESNTDDVLLSADLSSILEGINIDSIPEINFNTDTLTRILAIYGAKDRSLDSKKVNKTDTSKIAAANKLLYLDAAGKLPATAANADKLGGKDINYFATKTDLNNVSNSLSNDVIRKDGGGTITNGWLKFKDSDGSGMGYGIQWVDKDNPSQNIGFLNETQYSGTAHAAQFDVEGREFTTAYAKKTDVPAVWDSDGHLVSPAGWSLWVVNEDPAPPVVEIPPSTDEESSSGTKTTTEENTTSDENPTT